MPILRNRFGIITNAFIESPEEFLQLESLCTLFQSVVDKPNVELSNAEFFSLQKVFDGFRIDHSIGGYSASKEDKTSASNLSEALSGYKSKYPKEIEAARKKREEKKAGKEESAAASGGKSAGISKEELLQRAKNEVKDFTRSYDSKCPPKSKPQVGERHRLRPRPKRRPRTMPR